MHNLSESDGGLTARRLLEESRDENALMHKDRDNRRMMIVCLALCITLIVLVITLVAYYPSRPAMWNETIADLSTKLVEVSNAHTPP